jgi:hypothetical protein
VSPQLQHRRLTVVAHTAPDALHVRTAPAVAEQLGIRTTHTADIRAMATETNQVAAHTARTTGTMAARAELAATAAGEASGHKSKSAGTTNEDKC